MPKGVRGFQKGQAGGPGRPKGCLSWKTIDARTVMQDLKFDPISELIKRYRDPRMSEKTANFCLAELAKRYAPVLKSVEVIGLEANKSNGGPPMVTINIIAPEVHPGETIDATIVSDPALTHDQTVAPALSELMRQSVIDDIVDDET